ncbi:hypothetical protein DJ97_3169 [Bacillus spizizenii]|nr:hypothetical protein DJ97_3169 [Bacillus spizizenii]
MASRSKREICFSKLKKHNKPECISFDIHSCFLGKKRREMKTVRLEDNTALSQAISYLKQKQAYLLPNSQILCSLI